MNCSFCGKEIKEGAKFCHFCGTRAPSELPKNIVAATASVTGEESGNVIETAKEFVDAATPQAEPQTTAENLFSAQETAQAESSVEEIAVSDETTAPNAQKIQMDTGITDVQANRKPKSKKKLFVILSAVIVALAVVFSALAICLVQVFADSAPTTPIKAYTYSKGACICYDNGKLININGSLQNAYITPDRERVIYVDKNGKLCWYATDKDTKHDIYDFNSTDTVEIVGICNDMIFFVANSTLYRYSFDEFVFTTVVGSDGLDSAVISSSVYYSGDFGTVAYVRNGGIYVLSEDAFSPNLITHATTTATLKIHDVSCDGELVLWSSYENGIYTLYLWTEDTNGKGDILKQATLAEDDTSS